MKRLLAILLALTLLPVSGVFAAREEQPRVITAEDYAAVDAMWQEVEQIEGEAVRSAVPITERTAAAVAEAVAEHDLYVDGTLRWNGAGHFTFETTVGVTCGYSVALRNKTKGLDRTASEGSTEQITYGETNTAGSKEVYVLQPYYGIDSNFTKQYQNEGKAIAQTINGTYHLYTGTKVTVDVVAEAMEEGAVVIFDSHGDTDYARGSDYTSGATTSYLCLTTAAGLTDADYANDNGTYHAVRYYDGDCAVDGTCISNHMEGAAPNSILWMAICLSMATDGLHAPLMENGVSVSYGYSQSVTFDYDYAWEEVFWDEMCDGKNVADSIARMKEEVGYWDYYDYYSNINSARNDDCAFPIVVSEQDAYPGQGKVDDLQTVYSTWVLPFGELEPEIVYTLTACSNDEGLGTVSVSGNTVTATPEEGAYIAGYELAPADAATVTREGNVFCVENLTADCCLTVLFEEEVHVCYVEQFADVDLNAWYHEALDFAVSQNIMGGVSDTTFEPDGQLTRAMLATILYRLDGGTAIEDHPFTDVTEGQWYAEAVAWAYATGVVNGTSETTFTPNAPVTREQTATMLYRYASYAGQASRPTGNLSIFIDADLISDYAKPAMRWAVGEGIINGREEGILDPKGTATRAEIAQILYGWLN